MSLERDTAIEEHREKMRQNHSLSPVFKFTYQGEGGQTVELNATKMKTSSERGLYFISIHSFKYFDYTR